MSYESINPFTEELIATYPEDTDAELQSRIELSAKTFRTDWRLRSYAERATVIDRAATLLREKRDEFAERATREMGKLYREAKGEVMLCADILDFYAKNAATILAPKRLEARGGASFVESEPLGPLFCVEPWNFPYYQLARVAGPNLMAGNTLIMKHAPSVPQCAVAFERLLLDAGAPTGAYQNAFLSNDQAAVAIADVRIRGVALTGSERAGAAVAAEAGKALKKSTMELGGSDAFIVLDDADMTMAVRLAVAGRMINTGQTCTAAKRFIVHNRLADEFITRFRAELEKLVPGDPMADSTSLGPLVGRAALAGVLKQIAGAVTGGATITTGGRALERRGFFLAPTILENVKPGNPAFYQEFFAPVAMVFRVNSDEEAIALANDSPYGLGGSVISSNMDRAQRVARQLETGMVFVNAIGASLPELPFGGVKNSGFGRELSDLGINEFVSKKLIRLPS